MEAGFVTVELCLKDLLISWDHTQEKEYISVTINVYIDLCSNTDVHYSM